MASQGAVAVRTVDEIELPAGARPELQSPLLADRIPQLAWVVSPAGLTEYFNRRCLEYLGLTAKQAAGLSWQWLVHPCDLPQVRRAWGESLRTGTPCRVALRLRRADGTYRWQVGQGLPLKDQDGQITGWLATCCDLAAGHLSWN